MRLIDADALKDGYMHMGYDPNEHPEESYMEGWCKGFNAAVDHCIGHVIHAPTIEPEQKKGKWIRHPTNREYDICTSCGIGTRRREYGANADGTEWQEEVNFAFCPWCGADNREGQEE